MTCRLLLVCHAATPGAGRLFPADEAIRPDGLAGAAALAGALVAWLPGSRRVVASPARAARASAEAMFGPHRVAPGLRELDYGAWAGRAFADIVAADPDAVAEWRRNPAAAPHGGESIADLLARAGAWLDGVAAEASPCIAVTHGSVVRAVLVGALGFAPDAFWRVDAEPLSSVALTHDGHRWALRLRA